MIDLLEPKLNPSLRSDIISNTISMTVRQAEIRALFDALANERACWVARNHYFYDTDLDYMKFIIREGLSILDIGCGDGRLLAALKPSRGVGVDFSLRMVEQAQLRYPELEFVNGNCEDPQTLASLEGPFDVIIISDTIGYLEDCQGVLSGLTRLCAPHTRLVISYYSRGWEPILRLGERLKLKMPGLPQNWLSTEDIINLLMLSDFEVVRREWRQLLPKKLFGFGPLINKTLAPLPLLRRLCLRNYVVGRPVPPRPLPAEPPSVSVVVPCRNERGNIEFAIRRMPSFAPDIEVVFVEGHSSDGTYEECLRVQKAWPDAKIKVLRQDGKGKGDAVRKGFAAATGDILMILDADLTTPPECLEKFYTVIATGKGEFVNGTRMIYPMDSRAMRFLNSIANRFFAIVFSYLLNQRFTDTLCGTKVIRREDYQRISDGRSYFGEFDPFGDFDLIFGAAKLNLKIIEVPIRYTERVYGETQISRFYHGLMLIRMMFFAWRKLKSI